MKKIKSRKLHNLKEVIDIDVIKTTSPKNTYTKSSKNNEINIPTLIILIIILSLISGSLGSYFMLIMNEDSTTTSGVPISTVDLKETNSISTAVEKVYDSVVVVEATGNESEGLSTGTGFVYKKDKKNNKIYLMTNNHVISGAKNIKVILTDKKELEAELVGSDVYSDIAVLSVKYDEKIKSAIMGASTKSKVGDTLFTVGSPEGSDYAGTVTKGILSAQERLVAVALSNNQTTDYYMKVLQTDAAINRGNSGGPICNTNGEVIGITNMKLVGDTIEGMGFAIPIEEALKVSSILEKEGKVTRPYIGISMLDLTESYYLWQAGIMVPENIEEGVVIYNIEKNSPAAQAKLEKGDIIIQLAETKIGSLADFRYELYKHSPNEEVKITYVREGKVKETKITLGKSE